LFGRRFFLFSLKLSFLAVVFFELSVKLSNLVVQLHDLGVLGLLINPGFIFHLSQFSLLLYLDCSQLIVGCFQGLEALDDFFDGVVLSARLIHNLFEELLVLLYSIFLFFNTGGFFLQNLSLHHFPLNLLLLLLILLFVLKNIVVGLLHGFLVSIKVVRKCYQGLLNFLVSVA